MEQARTAFLSLTVANVPVNGYSINSAYKDAFDVYALTASPATAGGPVTLHATLSLESAPALIEALDRNQVISFEITFVKPGLQNVDAPFAILKGLQGQLTGFSILAVSGRPVRAQVTLALGLVLLGEDHLDARPVAAERTQRLGEQLGGERRGEPAGDPERIRKAGEQAVGWG